MTKIKNKLFQPLTVLVSGNRSIYLQGRKEAEVSKGDLETDHVKALINQGHIAVVDSENEAGGGAGGGAGVGGKKKM
jgi:hypothetical protein